MTEVSRPPRKRLSRTAHWALDGLGAALFATGTVGIFVPYMPTTVFWIGAVLCFLKTRPHAVRPMLRTPIIGPAIRWYLRWRPFGGSRRRRNTPPKA